MGMIFDGPCVVEDADIFAFLRSPLNLLPDGDEWSDGLDRTAQEKPPRVGVTQLPVWGKRFVFRMEEMTPDNAGKRLRREDFAMVFASQLYYLSAMNLRVFPG